MDFNFSPEQAAYRARVCNWVEEHLPGFLAQHPPVEPQKIDETRARYGVWQRMRHDARLTCVLFPEKYGGAGLGVVEHYLVTKEVDALEVVPPINRMGFGVCLPMILHAGSDAQMEKYLPPALRGEAIWCQLFSEPGAGSDLAGLKTKADLAEGGWRLNGRKTWITNAQYADFGVCLARSDPAATGQQGLTIFVVNMRQPGVKVRPIQQANGDNTFNEVFFDDVRIENTDVLGGVDQGWRMVIELIMIERSISNLQLIIRPSVERVVELAREQLREAPPTLATQSARRDLAALLTRLQIMDIQGLRVLSSAAAGRPTGPEGFLVKLDWSELNHRAQTLALDLLGPEGLLGPGEETAPGQGAFPKAWLASFGPLIAGGGSEILRNMIAEKSLGLPGDATFP